MELTEHTPGNHHVIREIDARGVRIDQDIYTTSLILGARYLKTDWPVTALDELDSDTLAPLFKAGPELVIIGAGTRHQVLDLAIQREFVRAGIGIECMTLAAAARTFNVLMSENRRALAALILPPHETR